MCVFIKLLKTCFSIKMLFIACLSLKIYFVISLLKYLFKILSIIHKTRTVCYYKTRSSRIFVSQSLYDNLYALCI